MLICISCAYDVDTNRYMHLGLGTIGAETLETALESIRNLAPAVLSLPCTIRYQRRWRTEVALRSAVLDWRFAPCATMPTKCLREYETSRLPKIRLRAFAFAHEWFGIWRNDSIGSPWVDCFSRQVAARSRYQSKFSDIFYFYSRRHRRLQIIARWLVAS